MLLMGTIEWEKCKYKTCQWFQNLQREWICPVVNLQSFFRIRTQVIESLIGGVQKV